MTGNRMIWMLGAVCLFQAGVISGQILDNPAHAAEVSAGSPSMLCKSFMLDTAAPIVDTTDTKSAAGEWTSDREAEGWVMYGIDMEMASKSTGFPQAWAQICLYKQ